MKWIVNILDGEQETGAWIVGPFQTREEAKTWMELNAPEGMGIVDELVPPKIYLECAKR